MPTAAPIDKPPLTATQIHEAVKSAYDLGQYSYGDWKASLVQDMVRAGHGARAIVVGYKSNPPGHAFNVINENGKIVFIDAQVGVAPLLSAFDRADLIWTQSSRRRR